MLAKDRDGRSELHHCALRNDAAALRTLLVSGAASNEADKLGFTPLHFAAQENARDAACVLLELGADSNAKNLLGNTPLWTAVYNYQGDGTLIQMLLEHGANPTMPNNQGKTPRDLAHLIANYDVRKYFP